MWRLCRSRLTPNCPSNSLRNNSNVVSISVLETEQAAISEGCQIGTSSGGEAQRVPQVVSEMLHAVVAVIINGDKALLVERVPTGHWAPVSGSVEPGETQEAAVAREAMEEVGLNVRPIRKVWENISTNGSFVLHWWLAEYVAGELALQKTEVSDARWLTAEEIRRMDKTYEGDREFFEKLLPSLVGEK